MTKLPNLPEIRPTWAEFLSGDSTEIDTQIIWKELYEAIQPYESGTFEVDFGKCHPFKALVGTCLNTSKGIVCIEMEATNVRGGIDLLKSRGIDTSHISRWSETPHIEVTVQLPEPVNVSPEFKVDEQIAFTFNLRNQLESAYCLRRLNSDKGVSFPGSSPKIDQRLSVALISHISRFTLDFGTRIGPMEYTRKTKNRNDQGR